MSTGIEYLDDTWPVVTGCTRVSAGCDHCWARRVAKRLAANPTVHHWTRYKGFRPTAWPERLDIPLHWRKPKRIGVAFGGDLFHEDIPFDFIDQVFASMTMCRYHRYLLLTKRIQRAGEYFARFPVGEYADLPTPDYAVTGRQLGELVLARWPLPNVWLGVSVEDLAMADERIPVLLDTPAAVRSVSVEPMLGPVDIRPWSDSGLECSVCSWRGSEEDSQRVDFDDEPDGWACPECEEPCAHRPIDERLDWVVCGAETGKGARRMNLDWARRLRDDCQAAGAPFFFKRDSDGNRELDGKMWEGLPAVAGRRRETP